jgi:mannosyltransferase
MQPLLKEDSACAGSSHSGATVAPVATWSIAAALLLAAFYFASSLYISSHRLLWVDEINTVNFSRLPGFASIWKALSEGAEGMPPTYFMTVRVFDKLFGHSELAVRLPSALALIAGLLITFDCTRRLTDGLHGLIAFVVLSCSFLPYYGHEARSYAIYFMLSALALWIWIHTRDKSLPAAIAFGAVLLLGVTMHYYAVLILVPYAGWEVLHWKPWRLPSRKIVAGVLGVICAAAALWKPIQAQRHQFPSNFWARPSPDVLPTAYSDLFPDFLFPLALVMIWIALVAKRDKRLALQPMHSGERIGWLFLVIPLAGYVLSEVTHVFQLRYIICTLPGIAIALPCSLWRHFHGVWRVSIGVFLILAGWGLAKQVAATRDPNRYYYSPIRQMLSLEDGAQADGKRFFVVCNQARYIEALYYSKHSDQYVWLMLPTVDPHRTRDMMTLAQFYPIRIWTLDDLRNHASESALLVPLSNYLDTLKQAGFQIENPFPKSSTVVYVR